jgi:hypothetical protein
MTMYIFVNLEVDEHPAKPYSHQKPDHKNMHEDNI